MATMDAEQIFIDTNVLVYASRPSAPEDTVAQEALSAIETAARRVWISPQVLREYLAVVTRPQVTAPPLPMATAIDDVRRFRSMFEIAEEGPAVFERLLQLLTVYPGAGKQVHDANLVAAMLVHGVGRLLTFNVTDFQRFAGTIEIEAVVRL